ncbi:DUF2332 family protein [Microbacterium sp. NPDC078428]|uniref:DUF2332 family protein n=1 Tax=Microbacterium sp. NPDC078428 TaxID=3364190 RepID=UPI0037C808E3
MDDAAAVIERYARFADDEARGRSDVYEDWARGIAEDPETAALLARIPATRRQPPLVFAVARMQGAPVGPWAGLRRWLREHGDRLVAEASARSLQTNEPLRCAPLVAALSLVPGPVALVELGASAGLCLYPDRYSYRFWGTRDVRLDPVEGPATVVLASEMRGAGGGELTLPRVLTRVGVDLAPLDARDAADRAFLEALVWPGEDGRAERIAAALDVAAAAPPRMIAGDAADPATLDDAIADARRAAPGASIVVTTPGLLPHVPRAGREELRRALTERDVRWVSIHPAGMSGAQQASTGAAASGFHLTLDGQVVAKCDPLGAWLEWRAC